MTPRDRSALSVALWFLGILGWLCVVLLLAAMAGCASAPTSEQCKQAVKDCPTGSCVVVFDSGPVHVNGGRCK